MRVKPKHYRYIHIATTLPVMRLKKQLGENILVEIQDNFTRNVIYKFFLPPQATVYDGKMVDIDIVRSRLKRDAKITFDLYTTGGIYRNIEKDTK